MRLHRVVVIVLVLILVIAASASGEWLEFGAGCPENSEPLTFHNITMDDLISFDVELQGLLRDVVKHDHAKYYRFCLLYTSPSPRDRTRSRMPSSA